MNNELPKGGRAACRTNGPRVTGLWQLGARLEPVVAVARQRVRANTMTWYEATFQSD